jgi:hypothetical protein
LSSAEITLWTPKDGVVKYVLRQAVPELPSCRLLQGVLDAEERDRDIVRKTQMSCCVQLDCDGVVRKRKGLLPLAKASAHAHGLDPVVTVFPVKVEWGGASLADDVFSHDITSALEIDLFFRED